MGSASNHPYIYFQRLNFSQPLVPMHFEWHYYSALCTLYTMAKWRLISTVLLFTAEPTSCTFFCVLSARFLDIILRGWYERRNFAARDSFLLLDIIYVPLPIFFACFINTCKRINKWSLCSGISSMRTLCVIVVSGLRKNGLNRGKLVWCEIGEVFLLPVYFLHQNFIRFDHLFYFLVPSSSNVLRRRYVYGTWIGLLHA
jgi:hypothetical protein